MLESPVMPETSTRNLVEIRGLVKHFDVRSEGKLRQQRRVVHAINGVDLDVPTGEIVALVGESGSGKTTLANCVAGFVTPTSGTIGFDGRPLVETRGATVARRASRREMAQNIQMVFQDPSSALNPRQTVESTLLEPLLVHRVMPKPEAVTRVTELLELSGIPASMRRRYPHELNSGQRQRLVIARALALSPRLLLADEPVSRLDVSMQSQILNLLLDLRERLGLTIVFITHDLSVVRQVGGHGRGDVPRPGDGVMQRGRVLLRPPAPVQPGARRGDAAPDGRPDGDRHAPRRDPQPDQPAVRLPVPHALPDGGGGVHGRGARAARGRGRPPRGLHQALTMPRTATYRAYTLARRWG